MSDPVELVSTEWSVVLDGDLRSLGDHYEMDGLDEATARKRKAHWNALQPGVQVTLRSRRRRTVLGEWETQA